MQMGEEASLLDDARFVEELAKLEALPHEDTSAFPKSAPTVGEHPQPVAIADELPPALGPRTKGPQFVLAPPPSRRRSSSHRRADRTIVRIRTSTNDDRHAAATQSVSIADSASGRTTPDDTVTTPPPQRPERNDAEASLNSFPTESTSTGAGIEGKRVRQPRSSAVHPALAVVGFVLMMSVGAGAAALVFHDRVAQIVQLLERSAARR